MTSEEGDAPMATLPDSEISSLSDSQERTLSSLTMVSCTLSIIGSSMIIYLVRKSTRLTPYKRILLGLSVADIIASLTWAFSPFLLPAGSSQRVWAHGNDATCTFLGFLSQLSLITVWYNGMLSYYYLLTVRYRVSATTFATRYEPWFHIASVGYNLIAGIVGVAKGYYSEMELSQGCYIAEYPEGCEINGGCTGALIGWIVSGAPALIAFMSILVNNAIIYYHVKRTTNRTIDKSFQGRVHQNRRIQAVATQAFLYVGTFLVAYLWMFIIRVAESIGVQASDEAKIYPLLILSSIFLPLQGLFNLLVYSRPNYLRVRNMYPKESRFFALKQVWFANNENRFTSIDAGTLRSRNVNVSMASTTGAILNIDQVRLRVSQEFSKTFSGKDPLRRDIRMRENNLMEGATSSSDGGRTSWNREQPSSHDGTDTPQSQRHDNPAVFDPLTNTAPPRLVMMDHSDPRLGESQVGLTVSSVMTSEIGTSPGPDHMSHQDGNMEDQPGDCMYEEFMYDDDGYGDNNYDASSRTDLILDVSNR